MPPGHSRRGPKNARCPRSAGRYSDSSDRTMQRSSRSTSRSSSSHSRVRFSEDTSALSSSSNSKSTVSPAPSSIVSRNSTVAPNSLIPDMKIESGDRQETFVLPDKGKLVILNKKNGDLQYMLRCVDGRRVIIEKTVEGAALLILSPKGQVVKALSGYY